MVHAGGATRGAITRLILPAKATIGNHPSPRERFTMRANGLTAAVAILAAVGAMPADSATPTRAAAPDAARAFDVQDLVRLDRISEPAVSPDGKRVAYSLRTVEMELNQVRTGIGLLETRKRDAAPVRLTDLAANSNSAEWSGDGRFIYYLSDRGGSTQVWRSGPEGELLQITNLPLDVGSFRVSPKADRLLVSLEVFADCADLACTKQRLVAAARNTAHGHGVLYDRIFARHWDTWSEGRRTHLFAITLDEAGLANGTPVNLTAGIDGDVPSKPFGSREDYAVSADGREVAFSVRALPVSASILGALTLSFLGRSFSVMPEARRLVTTGPYSIVRH